MNVLITGGAGYLGSITCLTLLEAGHSVRVFDNLRYGGASILAVTGHPRFDFVRGDVCSAAEVASALRGMDAVVHLAAIVGDPACAQEPEYARRVNTTAALSVYRLLSGTGVDRMVFASTCSNYGRMRDTSELATEEHELRPVSLYAETKVSVETEILNGNRNGPCASVLRFATLYGMSPRMRFDLTVNEFTMRLLTERKLTVYGEQFWRPYVHVRDAARAILTVLEAPHEQICGAVFNVGHTQENYRKADIVNLIQQHLTGETEVSFVAREEDPRDYRVCFDKIHDLLGFQITRRVPDGILEISRALASGLVGNTADPRLYNLLQ